jgi:type IV pilus assembly protein PilW
MSSDKMVCVRCKQKNNHGFSLVELMVAITISSFIVLLVGQVFFANKTVYRSQSAQAEVQEKGRFLMRWIAGQLRQAGYVDTSRLSNSMPTNFVVSGTDFPTAGMILNETASYTIGYRYYGNGDNQIIDCNGSPNASAVLNTSKIALTASNTMSCTSSSSQAGAAQQVMTNVSQFVMKYGVDNAIGTADRIPDSYLPAASVADWTRVFSVQVCALVESETRYVAPSNYSISDCGGNAYTPGSGRIGRVFRTTVYLRNNFP